MLQPKWMRRSALMAAALCSLSHAAKASKSALCYVDTIIAAQKSLGAVFAGGGRRASSTRMWITCEGVGDKLDQARGRPLLHAEERSTWFVEPLRANPISPGTTQSTYFEETWGPVLAKSRSAKSADEAIRQAFTGLDADDSDADSRNLYTGGPFKSIVSRTPPPLSPSNPAEAPPRCGPLWKSSSQRRP